MDSYILFIGMGDWDIPQLATVKELGYKSIVTNKDPLSKALALADVPVLADGKDVLAILTLLYDQELDARIKYVYTGTELFLSAALISQALNIPWHSPKSALICEKKHLMRAKFNAKGIKTANGFSASDSEELAQKIYFRKKKYIIKPSDSLSSQGVCIVDNADQINNAVSHALSFSLSKKVVCEEFIKGTLHDVNGILNNEEFFGLGINDKAAGEPPYAVVVKGSAPTNLSSIQQKNLYKKFHQACLAVGLTTGPVKGDCILGEDGEFYFMEVAPRLHGPLGSLYLIPQSLGITPLFELLSWVKSGKCQEHIINKEYPLIECCASEDGVATTNTEKKVIKVFRKKGKESKMDWKSNNDVPYYIIYSNS